MGSAASTAKVGPGQIRWDVSREDALLIRQIAKRAAAVGEQAGVTYPMHDAEMDLTAAHLNGSPLDLQRLLDSPPVDFGHDVFGIRRFIDRTTGELGGCFSPRCSRAYTA